MPRLIDAFSQFFDDNGDPLINGKLKFVESGTNNTDKDTFADINETIANTNPVILDGAGRCPNVFGTGSYNVISYTSADVQIQQFDPVSGDTLEGAFSEWNAITIYGEGDIVTGSDGLYYRSISSANQNQNPVSTPGQWEEIKFVGVWNTVVSYDLGDVVYGSDGHLYRSSVNTNVGNDPITDTVNWGNAAIPEWIIGASYSIGNLVFGSNGLLYSSNIDTNVGNDPTTDSVSWTNISTQSKQIQDITATVDSSAMTVGLSSTVLDFRDETLTDGGSDTIIVPSALSLVIPLDATLGTINAVQSRIIILAINNAGTAELAVVNLSGGNDLSEEGIISTTAIDATSDSDNVFYSETARANVPYRVVGMVESTQATAGTWATSPTLIQGAGGNALTSMSSLGYGQTWQDVLGSRASGVTYYNTTGKPITVSVYGTSNTASAQAITATLVVDGVTIESNVDYSAGTVYTTRTRGIIPPGSSYSVTISFSISGVLTSWKELR
jgi:hypothetical protein